MKARKFINRYTAIVALLCAGILPQSAINAAPALTDTPLFLKTTAESNVFFLMDTSGSMTNEMMTPEDCGGQGGCWCISKGPSECPNSQRRYFVYYQGRTTLGAVVIINSDSDDVVDFDDWAARSYDYNKMYYNPARTYEPWPGTDENGDVYPDANVNAARVQVGGQTPFDPTPNADTVDLEVNWDFPGAVCTIPATPPCTSPLHYYTWADDGDGIPEALEGTRHDITSATEIQNFANWFVYHRSRNLSAKFALGKTVTDIPLGTRLRLGYEVLRYEIDTTDDGTDNPVPDIFDQLEIASITSTVATAGDSGYDNMVTFRTAIYANVVGNSTPTRQAYARSANYFACDGSSTPFGNTACALQKTAPAGVGGVTPTDLKAPAACQQNFLVLMTDGAYIGSFPAAHADKDDADNDLGVVNTVFDANGPSPLPDLGGPYESATTETLADLAMYYYETDLDTTTGIGNQIPISCGQDENSAQHLITYALSFGIPKDVTTPTRHPLGMDPSCATIPADNVDPPATGWRDTSGDSSAYRTNDMVHATYNGRGNFYDADNPEALLAGLQDALQDAASRTGASAGIGVSSTTNSGGTIAYLATFRSVDWFGELYALAIDVNGVIEAIADADWTAHSTAKGYLNYDDSAEITGDKVQDNRTIITYDPDPGVGEDFGLPFQWASLRDTQKYDLRTDSDGVTSTDADGDVIAEGRLDYIRGDQSCETECTTPSPSSTPYIFRSRISRLGDIINSTPVYVGTPVANYPNTGPFPTATPYRAYRDGSDSSAFTSTGIDALSRTPVLYVGANDGMLHAFNAGSSTAANEYAPNDPGNEIFTYIPGALYNNTNVAGLHLLTENNAHISYVDQTPTIADAFTSTATDSDRKWRTVLVGGLRNGGRGIYALDVTDPDYIRTGSDVATREARAAQTVMWEFTSNDDGDLGYTYSQPVIVPMRVDSGSIPIEASNTDNAIEWFAVFGNGYNSNNEHSVLFLLKLSGPTGGTGNTWTLNTDYFKIDTGYGGPLISNGLSSPAVVDTNGDKIFDRVYAGDLQGRMWAFDVSQPASALNWVVDGGDPLLIAQDTASVVQPITVKPTIARNVRVNTDTPNEPNIMVMFGTGSYLADGDETNEQIQTFYGVYDDGSPSSLDRNTTAALGGLIPQAFITTGDANVRAMNTTSTYDVDYDSVGNYAAHIDHHHGWYIDLPDTRERVASKATLVGSTLFFATIVPDNAPCDAGGSGWLMAVDPMDGHSPGINTFDITGDAIIDVSDTTTLITDGNTTVSGVRSSSMVPQYSFLSRDPDIPGTPPCASGAAVQVIGAATDASTSSQTTCAGGGSGKAGRYSWRQLDF